MKKVINSPKAPKAIGPTVKQLKQTERFTSVVNFLLT